jgi:hypothetical protein
MSARNSFDISKDSMAQARYNKKHPLEPDELEELTKHEQDCTLDDDDENPMIIGGKHQEPTAIAREEHCISRGGAPDIRCL